LSVHSALGDEDKTTTAGVSGAFESLQRLAATRIVPEAAQDAGQGMPSVAAHAHPLEADLIETQTELHCDRFRQIVLPKRFNIGVSSQVGQQIAAQTSNFETAVAVEGFSKLRESDVGLER
jgi:hypothetical protein